MQNRVNPFGEIVETKARGLWMGNRGHIHNEHHQIIRPFKLKAWITCKLEYKGRSREIMAANHYTELFFLDEATAFAAGHRPCCECRREDYNKFKRAWLKRNPGYKLNYKTSVRDIDGIIQMERINKDGSKKTYKKNSRDLPDGTFITINDKPYLLFMQSLYLWTPSGYIEKKPFTRSGTSIVLTPKSIVNVFRVGYIPQMNIT